MILIIGNARMIELLVLIEDIVPQPIPPILELKALNFPPFLNEIDFSIPERQKSIQRKKKSAQLMVSNRSKLNVKRTRFPA